MTITQLQDETKINNCDIVNSAYTAGNKQLNIITNLMH